MKPDYLYDFFISHSSHDKPYVRELAMSLRDMGMRIWFDEWIIRPGDDIYLSIEKGLAESQILLLCMSPAFFASDWVGLERSTAMFRDPTNKNRRFVPVLLEECAIPDALRRYKYIDLRKRIETHKAIAELFAFFSDDAPAAGKSSKEQTLARPIADRKDLVRKRRAYKKVEALRDKSIEVSCVLFLDVDRFSHINNTFGIEIGDKVLRCIREILDAFDEINYCGRWGGDEYICYLQGCTERKALKIGKLVRNAIYGFDWESVAPNLFVTVSIGVALARHKQTTDIIIERTILGSRNAKRVGGNEVKLSPLVGLPRTHSYKGPVEYLYTFGS